MMDLSQEKKFFSSGSRVTVPAASQAVTCPGVRGFGVGSGPHRAPIGIEASEPWLVPLARVALQKAIGISRPCPWGTDVRTANEGANHKWLMAWSRGPREAAQAGMGPLRRLVFSSATTGFHSGFSINRMREKRRREPGREARSNSLLPSCLPSLWPRPLGVCPTFCDRSSV